MVLQYGIIYRRKGDSLWEFCGTHYYDKDRCEMEINDLKQDNKGFEYEMVVFP